MPINWSDPTQVQQARQDAVQSGYDPKQVDAYIAQHSPNTPSEVPMSLGGLANNAVNNVGDMVKGLANIPAAMKQANYSPAQFMGNMAIGAVKSLGETVGIKIDQKSGLTWSPQNALRHAYEKPVDTVLNVLPFAGMAKGALLGEGAAAAEGAEGAAVAGEDVAQAGKLSDKIIESGAKVKQGVRQIKLPAAVGAAQKEELINQTLDQLGFDGTPQQQYTMLQPKMTELENNIRPTLEKNMKIFAPEQVRNDIVSVLDDQGFLVGKKAKDVAQSALDDVMADVVNKNGKDQLTSVDLFDVKQKLNKIAHRLSEKAGKGGMLTPTQEVLVASRDALDDVIGQYHPEVKGMTLAQSYLFDAAKPLAAARSNPPTFRFQGTSVPAPITIQGQRALGNAIQSTGKLVARVENAPHVAATAGPLLTGTESLQQNGQDVQSAPDHHSPNEELNASKNHTTPLASASGSNTGDTLSQVDKGVNTEQDQSQYPQHDNPWNKDFMELNQAAQKAFEHGDMVNYRQLSGWAQKELAYQKYAHPKLSGKGAAALSSSQNAVDSVNQALDDVDTTYKKELGPASGFVAQHLSPEDPTRAAFDAQMMTLADSIASTTGGSAQQVRAQLPVMTDTPDVAKAKLTAVKAAVERIYKTRQGYYRNLQPDAAAPDTGASDGTDGGEGGGGPTLPKKKDLGAKPPLLPRYAYR
jgi:hypothetical protein